MHILVKRRQEQETAGVEHLKIIYNFFAISHGKGAVDGIGGTAKRGGNNFFVPFFLFYLIPPSLPPGVMTKVLARKAIVKTAMDFAITGSAACPGIKFIYILQVLREGSVSTMSFKGSTNAKMYNFK